MTAGGGPADGVGRTLGAEAFLAEVEGHARRAGYGVPGLNHWLLAACSHPFLARVVEPGLDVAGVSAQARSELDAGAGGAPLAPAEVLTMAARAMTARGDHSVSVLHLVGAVIERAGLVGASGKGESDATTGPAAGDNADAPPPPLGAPLDGRGPAPSESAPSVRVQGPGPTSLRRRLRPSPRQPKAQATPLLDECGIDLTALAAAGRLGPVVGRDPEIDQIVGCLLRPSKPNPLLVGEAGVGKTALVEGLAQRIAAGVVPGMLAGRRVVALDMASLLRESRYYGKLEERLAAVVSEARAVRAILFIDESHAMVAAGGREGSGDVATLLKPALARGELAVIGATTDEEYRRVVAADAALERRFVVIRVLEPSRAGVREILRAVRDAIAADLGVAVDDAAIDHAILVASARMPHRREPDRAKDLIEQAVASALARGETRVDRQAIDAAADGLAGVPAVTAARIAALEAELLSLELLQAGDAESLTQHLSLTLAGLQVHPERPRAVVAVVDGVAADAGERLASTIAAAVFGSADRVVSIDVGSITEPSMLSGLLGTSQGYTGYGNPLPIHEVANKPHAVVRVRNVSDCHQVVRTLLARAIRDGFATDATGRRIHLSSAILLLEARRRGATARALGFRVSDGAVPEAESASFAAPSATALVRDELASEIDFVVVPTAATGPAGARLARHLVRQLAAGYLAAGIELSWDGGVEAYLG